MPTVLADTWAASKPITPDRRLPHLIATIGDSREDPAILSGFQKGGGSQINYACALAHQRWRLVADYGQSGQRTGQYLAPANIAAIIANPEIGTVHIMGVLNNVGQDYPTAATSGATAAADIIAASETFRKAGLNVVLEMELGQNGITGARLGQCENANQLLREYQEKTPGIYIHDARPVLLNFAAMTTANLFKTGMVYDGTHVTQRGAYYWGKSLNTLFETCMPAVSPPWVGSPFALPANGRWQLCGNPLFQTLTGGSTSTGVTSTTGGFPGSCTVNKTGAGTSVAITPALQNMSAAITFGAQGDNARLSMALNIADWSQGDWLMAMARVTVTNPSGLAGMQLAMVSTGDSVGTNISDLAVTSTWEGPDETHSLTLLTLPFQVPAYASKGSMVPTIYAYAFGAGSAFTVSIEQMAVFRRIAGY